MTINHWILGGTRYSDRTSWAKNPDSHWHLGQATGWILRKGFRLPQCFPQHWRKKLLWNTTPWPERMVCQPPKIMVCQPPNLRYNWYQSGIYIYTYILDIIAISQIKLISIYQPIIELYLERGVEPGLRTTKHQNHRIRVRQPKHKTTNFSKERKLVAWLTGLHNL